MPSPENLNPNFPENPNPSFGHNRRDWEDAHDRLVTGIIRHLANRCDSYVVRTESGRSTTLKKSNELHFGQELYHDYRQLGISLHDTSEAKQSKYLAWDIDQHNELDESQAPQQLNSLQTAVAIADNLRRKGFQPLLEQSSENSYHVWIKLIEPIPRLQAARITERIQDEIQHSFGDEIEFERFPAIHKNEHAQYGGALRAPGFNPAKDRYAGFVGHYCRIWTYRPQIFLRWLDLPGDDAAALVPEIIDKESLYEYEQRQVVKLRDRDFETAYYRQSPTATTWKAAKADFNAKTTWDYVLCGHLVSVGKGQWAARIGDDPCASTATEKLKVFGENAAPRMGLDARRRYSKWQAFETLRGVHEDTVGARQLLVDEGCWVDVVEPDDVLESVPVASADEPRKSLKPLHGREVRIATQPPQAPPKTPVVTVDNSIGHDDYLDRAVAELATCVNDGLATPTKITVQISAPKLIAKYISEHRPPNSLIAVSSNQAGHFVRDELRRLHESNAEQRREDGDPTELSFEYWDGVRESKVGDLEANCLKPVEVQRARSLKLSPTRAVCPACELRTTCTLQQNHKDAREADFMVVNHPSLALAGLTSFGERYVVFDIDGNLEGFLSVDREVKHFSQAREELQDVLEHLERSEGFMDGRQVDAVSIPIDNHAEAERRVSWLRQMREWIDLVEQTVRGPLSSGLIAHEHVPRGIDVLVAEAALAQGIESSDLGILLLASQRGFDAQLVGDDFTVTRDNAATALKIISITQPVDGVTISSRVHRRSPGSDDIEVEVVAACGDLPIRPDEFTVQHVVRCNQKSSPEAVTRNLFSALSEYQPESATIVTCSSFVQVVRNVADDRVKRVLSFEQAAMSTFDTELTIVLGCPPIDDSALPSGLDTTGFRMQKVDAECVSDGVYQVLMMRHDSAETVASFQREIRRKLGNIMGCFSPRMVLISDVFTGLKLGKNPLIPESVQLSELRSIFLAADQLLSGPELDRRSRLDAKRREKLVKLIPEVKKCTFLQVKPESRQIWVGPRNYSIKYTGPDPDLSRLAWYSRRDLQERAGMADRASQRKLKAWLADGTMLSNGGKGVAVRYALNPATLGCSEGVYADEHGRRWIADIPDGCDPGPFFGLPHLLRSDEYDDAA